MIHSKSISNSLHQVVEQLTEKCQQLQVEQKDCRQRLEQLQTEHAGALGKMEALRSKFTLPSVQMSLTQVHVHVNESKAAGAVITHTGS